MKNEARVEQRRAPWDLSLSPYFQGYAVMLPDGRIHSFRYDERLAQATAKTETKRLRAGGA